MTTLLDIVRQVADDTDAVAVVIVTVHENDDGTLEMDNASFLENDVDGLTWELLGELVEDAALDVVSEPVAEEILPS